MDAFWEMENALLPRVIVDGVEVVQGSRVRLHPRPGGDILDLALAEKVAIVESIQQDFEDKVHIAVIIEDDPGRDLGEARQPGHRFFFSISEVEPLDAPPERD